MSALRSACVWALVALAIAIAALPAQSGDIDKWRRKYPPDEELARGRKIVDEIDKEIGVVEDPVRTEFVAKIARDIVAVSDRPDLTLDVKILDMRAPNAFAVPGGFVRVTVGLLDMVESEHELAGVLAHEIAHVCYYHGFRQEEKDNQAGRLEVLADLAAILLMATGKVDTQFASGAIMAGRFLRLQESFGYSREFEQEADQKGIEYILKTNYNPAGYVTIMERFAADALKFWRGPASYRDYDTHPPSSQRVMEIRGYLLDHRVPINRALVLRGFTAIPEEVEYEPGKRTWQIRLGDQVVFQTAPTPVGGKSPAERAQEIAARMNYITALNGLKTSSVSVGERDGKPLLLFSGSPVLTFEEADAQFLGMDARAYARAVQQQLTRVLWVNDTSGRAM